MLRSAAIKSRTLLLLILGAVLLAHAVEHGAKGSAVKAEPELSDPTNFKLQVMGTNNVETAGRALSSFPMFEPTSDRWILNGKPIQDLAAEVQGLEIGPHGSSPVLVVQLPAEATVGEYQRAIASLAQQGICQVGVRSPPPAKEYHQPGGENPSGYSESYVSAYRVLGIKRSGVNWSCKDRFPPWFPS